MFHKESRPFGQELMCEYQDEVKSQGGEEITVNFDVKLVEVFQDGLEVDVYEYPDGYCRLVHLAYETARHEVDANKFMPHTPAPWLLWAWEANSQWKSNAPTSRDHFI